MKYLIRFLVLILGLPIGMLWFLGLIMIVILDVIIVSPMMFVISGHYGDFQLFEDYMSNSEDWLEVIYEKLRKRNLI